MTQESVTQQTLQYLNQIRLKSYQNLLSAMSGQPIPYPELTEEYRQKELEKERKTYMYGYGMSFQDDREFKDFQEGKLIL